MVTQYPHILKFDAVIAEEPYKDENGDTVIPPGVVTTIEIICRFEPNSKGETIITNDGKSLLYSWMIYMPLGQLDIPNKIEVIGYQDNGSVKGQGTIERFDRGQLNARAWV